MKECKICEEILPFDRFYTVKNKTDSSRVYYYNECKACRHIRDNARISSSPEKYFKHTFKALKHNRTKGFGNKHYKFNIAEEDLVDLWYEQEGLCALSGIALTHIKDGKGKKWTNATVDRIDPDIGYETSNIQLVCYRANLIKHDMTEEDLMFWVDAINEHRGLKGLIQQWS